MKVSFCEQKV